MACGGRDGRRSRLDWGVIDRLGGHEKEAPGLIFEIRGPLFPSRRL